VAKRIKNIQSIILVLISIVFLWTASCGQGIQETPVKYRSKILVKPEQYYQDSINIYYVLESMMIKHIDPFTLAGYYGDSTILYVDSILYSPDQLKFVILLITRHLHKKSDNAGGSYYTFNGNCFFAKRDLIGSSIKVFQYSTFNMSDYDTYRNIKAALIEYSFLRRATSQPWNETHPTYNFDDVRFWNSGEFNSVISTIKFVQMEEH
jgi:hypothetical protein